MTTIEASLLETAVDLVREAGELTLTWFRSSTMEIERKHDGTPVTQADKAAERFLREQIQARFPDDAIIGEEEDDVTGTSGRTWIIDPIDGTKAFTHGVPLYTNLLAVDDGEGPAVGVVNMPALGEAVWAGRGLGAFVNDDVARVSERRDIAGSYLSSCGFDYWSEPMMEVARRSGANLRTWGDGYGYALVATGRIDAMCDPQVAAVGRRPHAHHLEGGRRSLHRPRGGGDGGGRHRAGHQRAAARRVAGPLRRPSPNRTATAARDRR